MIMPIIVSEELEGVYERAKTKNHENEAVTLLVPIFWRSDRKKRNDLYTDKKSMILEANMSDPITLNEAAQIVGKTPGALRRLVNDGKIEAIKDSKGRHLVHKDSVLAHFANGHQTDRRSGATSVRSQKIESDPLILALRDQIVFLERSLEVERSEKRELRQQNKSLQEEVIKVMAEMRGMLQKEDKGLLSRWIRG
jgi:hypothetical protein